MTNYMTIALAFGAGLNLEAFIVQPNRWWCLGVAVILTFGAIRDSRKEAAYQRKLAERLAKIKETM